jgi:hypothetical protein
VYTIYLEAALDSVAGVTAVYRKNRIVPIGRILVEHVARKLNMGRKLMLSFVAVLAVGAPVTFCLVHATAGWARATVATQKTGIDDTWQGTLHTPQRELRIVLKIVKADAGALKVSMYSIDQGGGSIASSSASFDGGVLKYAIDPIDATYEGKMSSDGKSIAGSWKQGKDPLSLLFERATPETAWAIPEPPPKIPAMAADADPTI